jgi:para-aminobenzoate synthetase/4-amino-4-deoxychorismate lyase
MATARYSLLETMRLEEGAVPRVERHLARMRASAAALGFPWDEESVRATLEGAAASHTPGCWRLRLVVDGSGAPEAACTPHPVDTRGRWRVALAAHPVESSNPLLRHKTTDRRLYSLARQEHPGADDVLLWNERGEVTESTIANVVAEVDGARVTPPVSCGLLPGVLREELLERGEVAERVVMKADLARAPRVWLVNSLRGWIEATVE